MKELKTEQIVGKVFDRKASILKCLDRKYTARVSDSIYKLILQTIEGNGTVVTAGSGSSAQLAEKIAFDFSCIKIPSFFLSASAAVHGGLGAIRKKDLLIIISRGCRTQEIMDLFPIIQELGLKYIMVTENEESELSKNADIVLKVDITEDIEDYGILSIVFYNIIIHYFDIICLLLMEYRQYKFKDFLHTHPGGAFGERVKKHSQGKGKG